MREDWLYVWQLKYILKKSIIRNAKKSDIQGVLNLQELNLLKNISDDQKASGFVTTPFTTQQIQASIDLNGLYIAEENDQIVGYAFAASWDYFSQWAIFPYMVSRFSLSKYPFEITAENSFQYWPICIDKKHRGSGVFEALFEHIRIEMQNRYPIGVTFINQINQRSFIAHTKKLQMVVTDEFHFNGNDFYALAFQTDETVLNKH